MGGGGSSSSSSSQTTEQIDRRIAASENASVLQDVGYNNVSIVDGGAIQQIGDIAKAGIDLSEASIDSLYEFGGKFLDLIKDERGATLDAISKNTEKALTFVDKTTQDANARGFEGIAPWLVVGASVIAISYAWRK